MGLTSILMNATIPKTTWESKVMIYISNNNINMNQQQQQLIVEFDNGLFWLRS